MNTHVHKYRISPHVGEVLMPSGATLLHADAQGPNFCVWALVDPDAPICQRQVRPYPTGVPIPSDAEYISTFRLFEEPVGELVFHVFDRGELDAESDSEAAA